MGWRDQIAYDDSATTTTQPAQKSGGWRDRIIYDEPMENEAAPEAAALPPAADPVVPEKDGTWWDSTKEVANSAYNLVTGADRETEAAKEFVDVPGGSENFWKNGLMSGGLLTTSSDQEAANVIKNYYPDAAIEEDEKGNVIVDLTMYGGKKGTVNKPGLDHRDVLQGLFSLAEFAPAAKYGSMAKSAIGKMFGVGTLSATTQALNDGVAVASGSQKPTDNIIADVGLAGVGGAVFEGIAQVGSKAWKAYKSAAANGTLSDKQKSVIVQEALKLGVPADEINDGLLKKWARSADDAVNGGRGDLNPLEKEFDFLLTRGQRSGDDALLGAEDSLKTGRRGQEARGMMLGGQKAQEQRALDIVEEFKSRVAKDGARIEYPSDAGRALKDQVRSAAAKEKEKVGAAYDAAREANPALAVTDMRGVVTRAINGLEDGADPTLPGTSKVLSQLDEMDKSFVNDIDTGRADALFNLKNIETQRKSIVTAINNAEPGRSDYRQLVQIKKAYDEGIDEAVAQGLFKGDTAGIEKLKEARGLYADYHKKFRGRDDGGAFIKKLVEKNPTDAEVIKSLFSTSSFSNSAAENLAKKYKEILGADSDAWNQVRQAALDTLIKTTTSTAGDRSVRAVSGTQTLNSIRQAMKQNDRLMKELFTPDEIAEVRRFALLVQQSQPPLKNASGTTSVLIEEGLKAGAAGKFGGLDVALLGTDQTGALAAKKAGEVMMGWFSSRKARSDAAAAFRPFEKVLNNGNYEPVKNMAKGAGAAGYSNSSGE
ncbi:hypothetical protein [Allohahella sp. A8]|uniref:hypothetical protein n=1 Tax=Allohahella sp. A8 TaxID=3141461 RepID=UPI003A81307F